MRIQNSPSKEELFIDHRFQGLSGDKFVFDQNGDGPARYNIIHFKQIEPGRYKWVRVGEYVDGELKWNKSGKPRGLAVSQSPVFLVPSSSSSLVKLNEG